MTNSLATTLAHTFEAKNSKLKELHVIVEACPLATFITDARGSCVYVNQAYQELVCRDYHDALGDGWKRFVHRDDIDEVSRIWSESITNRETFDHRYRYVRPDGEIVPIHCRAARLPSGNYVGYSNPTNGVNCTLACDTKAIYASGREYA
jgi:PAS domain S-box-containing protein